MTAIDRLWGLEVLDSRGRPTVQASCRLRSGVTATVSVPSGASKGAAEAVELRDGEAQRYRGRGTRRAAGHVSGALNDALAGQTFESQAELDRALIALDGTPNKSRLGANALLAVSLAFARAQAQERRLPLYAYLAELTGAMPALPRPTINLFSGGEHAGGQVAIQDVLIVPLATVTMADTLAMAVEVFQCAAELMVARYGMRLLTADEGGLAPPFENLAAMFGLAVDAIQRAGLTLQRDIAIAVDVAASHFYRDGRYHLEDRPLTADEMIAVLGGWTERYGVISFEDGLAEDDWEHWPALLRALGGRARIMGDDLLCTQPGRIRQAIEQKAANALLLKVNQIGTLTEAAEANQLARAAGWQVTVSARSGETEDNWLADLAAGWAADHIKIGSVTQSERLAKYNRLLTIEAEGGLVMARFSR
jgi:enolase